MMYGRAEESAAVARLLDDARAGRSGALVVRGEAGIGKSLFLDRLVDRAAHDGPYTVLRTTGIESERELPFAGLHLLLATVLDRVDTLPGRQQAALRGALGLADEPGSAGSAGSSMVVGLAVLTLLAELAEKGPLLCVVDDAHWLDHASTDALLFAARRLHAEGVALVFAARHLYAPEFPAPGVAELWLTGLPDADAAALLDAHAADLPRHVRDQILDEARGNPLALFELPAAQREGHIPAYAHHRSAAPSHTRIQQTFTDRIGALPDATRTFLLVAAAEATGDLTVVQAAAARLDASLADAAPAEQRDLIGIADGRLAFRHPLIRTAAYRGAPASRRMDAHRAIAEVLTAPGDSDRLAWHLADATVGPDETAARLLEESGEHARTRGGYPAVEAAYERAAWLSPDPADRARRLGLAARAAADAGRVERAAALAAQAAPDAAAPEMVAELAQVRALAPYMRGELAEAHTILLDVAEVVGERLPAKAAFILFDTMAVVLGTGDDARIRETAARIGNLALPAGPDVTPFVDGAIGLADLAAGRPGRGVTALRSLLTDHAGPLRKLKPMERACVEEWAVLTGDLELAHDLSATLERECRSTGALGVLPELLRDLARTELFRGRLRDATAIATEAVQVAEDTGQSYFADDARGVLAHIAALGGDADECRRLAADLRTRRGDPGEPWAATALGLLDLAAGRPEEALRHHDGMRPGAGRHSAVVRYALPDHVEAAARLGRPAAEPLGLFADWARATGQAWAAAVVLRCRALTAADDAAGELFQEALAQHEGAGRPLEQARTELLYGEWLRRAGRPADARTPLRSASAAFDRLGAHAWAGRADGELRATGERRSARGSAAAADMGALGRLTPQELQVVRLAAAGLTNRDIGEQLFLSPRTVGYHLYNAYPKLGVASRAELAGLVDRDGTDQAGA